MTIRYFTSSPHAAELRHSLSIVSMCYEVAFEQVPERSAADVTIGDTANDTLFFSRLIFDRLYSAEPYYQLDQPLVMVDGRPDHLSTIFYLVNCLQELNPDPASRDSLGRFDAVGSVQMRNNITAQNTVAALAAQVIAAIPGANVVQRSGKSRIFLSHDMDTIYGSLMQDTYWCLRKMDIPGMAQVILSNLLKGPRWLNVDRIMAIESESDFTSTFFWMVRNDAAERGLWNSDYQVDNPKVQQAIQSVAAKGWHNGLHKSIGQSTSFAAELKSLPSGITSNRYHYLYFDTFQTLPQVEEAGLKLDCSLGFASEMGFRNSFGLPVHLFDIRTRQPFSFVECPLHCMDTTYLFYHKRSGDEFARDVVSFVEANNTNCVLSILFHNNYISDHKFSNYLKGFKQLLAYFHESGYRSISQDEILTQYA